MKLTDLNAIKTAYDDLQQGISNPIKINTAYGLLPNHVDGSPMLAKIRAITRYMMLNYHDELKSLKEAENNSIKEMARLVVDSIGTVENLPQQTHKENVDNQPIDTQDIQHFLTTEEKHELAQPHAGTTLEIITSEGKKIRTRSPNGVHKERTKIVRK